MSDRFKIAICVSGQTRRFNDNIQDFYEVLDLFSDFDYDLFGHTWADHEDPHSEVLEKFTEYRSDDQGIIWNSIIENSISRYDQDIPPMFWWQFLSWQDHWVKKERYINILNGTSDENYLDVMKELINGTVGQCWSAHESILLTNHHWKAESPYVLIVKMRWDERLQWTDKDVIQKQILQFKEVLYNFSHRLKEYENKDYPIARTNCLTANDIHIERLGYFPTEDNIYFNDHVFVFRSEAIVGNGILTKSPVKLFSELINHHQSGRTHYVLPAAHSLWVEWILSAGFEISPALPNIFTANGPAGGKINKSWGI